MTRRGWTVIAAVVAAIVVCVAVPAWLIVLSPAYKGEDKTMDVYPDDDVEQCLKFEGVRTTGWGLLKVAFRSHAGHYALHNGDNLLTIFRRLRSGQQEPIMLTVPSVRTMEDLARFLGEHLMLDSADVAPLLNDPALIVPNTYEVYWTITPAQFMERMQREHDAFWTPERRRKAKDMGMTPDQVCTLASIVDEETANNGEKPMIAGMYINRLSQDMPLQADPTVKYAVGDFSLRRILHEHLTVESPYNTYINNGLPPGPIRIASVAGIDAVLNYVHHDCIYMCAKEDFSGTHNFARTYAEHLRNARRYQQELNKRQIK